MPRPKRSKVAPSAPAARVTKPTKSTKSIAEPVPEFQAPKAGFNDMYDVSDTDEGVVTSARRVRKDNGKGKVGAARRRGDATRSDEYDLGGEDILSEPGENTKEDGHHLQANRSAGAGLEDIDLGSSSPAVEIGRRERGTPGVENSLLALGNFRRRPRQPSILGRAAARARSSSVESNLAHDNGLTTVGKRNNSMLGNRHSRQPSITGTIDEQRSGSIGLERGTPAHTGSIFDLGNFKRRARQPSILGTAQKARQPRPEYGDEEDDFNPEDESTPLNLSKTRDMTGSSSTSNSRKRKLSAAQVPRSSPPLHSEREFEPQDIIPATGSNHESEGEPQPSDEVPLPSVEAQNIAAEPMSETMAPPLSSSSLSPEPATYRAAQRLRAERVAPRGRRRVRDRTPPTHTQDSPISSPPSLTHSPNYAAAKPAPKNKRQVPPPSTFSTAQLQALLPRRRRRGARDTYDIGSSEDEIDVSGLASDDDELTHSTIRAPPSRRGIVPRIPPSGKAPRKSKAAPKLGAKKTYGARAALTTSDKENEEIDPDDSLAPLPDDEGANGSPENSRELEKRVGKELKQAARKFEEVDKWELEFEDCTASSSSPRDAR
jgi:hypothetical protein